MNNKYGAFCFGMANHADSFTIVNVCITTGDLLLLHRCHMRDIQTFYTRLRKLQRPIIKMSIFRCHEKEKEKDKKRKQWEK